MDEHLKDLDKPDETESHYFHEEDCLVILKEKEAEYDVCAHEQDVSNRIDCNPVLVLLVFEIDQEFQVRLDILTSFVVYECLEKINRILGAWLQIE